MSRFSRKFAESRNHLEVRFGRWAEIAARFRWPIILLGLLSVVLAASQLDRIRSDSSVETMLRKHDPQRILYDRFRHRYGRDEYFLVLVDAPDTIYDREFLATLSRLHNELESLPRIVRVDSLVNARDTRGEEDELIVDDLLQDLPTSDEQLAGLKQRIEANKLIHKQFVSSKDSATLMIIETDAYSNIGVATPSSADIINNESAFSDDAFATPPNDSSGQQHRPFITSDENLVIMRSIEAVLARYEQPGFHTILGGAPAMAQLISDMLGEDMVTLTLLAIGMIVLLLAVIFRRLAIVAIPPLVSIMASIVTLGLMVVLDIPLSIAGQILPSFLMAIGVGGCVHIFTALFQALDAGEDKISALRIAYERAGLAIMMTCLTTAGGLFSFVFADVQPIQEFGIITPLGVIVTMLFILILLPAVIAVLPMKARPKRDETRPGLILQVMCKLSEWSTRRPYQIIILWCILLGVSLALIPHIRIDHNMISWFPADSPIRIQTERISDEFGGATTMDIEIDTGQENGLHNPALLNAIDKLYGFAHTQQDIDLKVGNILSVIDINKELHQALNGNNPDYYQIPQDRALIAQELLLFENTGSDDLERLVDSQFSRARISFSLPFVNAVIYSPYVDLMASRSKELFDGMGTVTITGLITIMGKTVAALLNSLLTSYVVAFLVIAPLMMLLLGSFGLGLLSMIPNLCPVILTLGLMTLLDVPIDLFTLLIGSIALGLSVDDTIHFMHNYQRYYHETGDSAFSVQRTLQTTGMALTFTTLILCASFMVYVASNMNNLFTFGWLTSFCLLVAFFADVLLAPALMTILDRWRKPELAAAAS